MASRFLRRSGIAIVLVAELIEYEPDHIIQVGIGKNHQEVDVMKVAWPNATFVGFEANPHIGIDDYPGKLIRVAVGAEAGKATLYFNKKHKDGSSFFPHNDPIGPMQVEVDVVALDDMSMEELDMPIQQKLPNVLLWLDCEGMEFDVLRGCEKLLDQHVDVVNVEMTSNPPGDGWCTPNEVHDFLLEHGFLRQWVHTQRTSAGQTDAIYVRPHLFNPNYCCCPCQVKLFKQGAEQK